MPCPTAAESEPNGEFWHCASRFALELLSPIPMLWEVVVIAEQWVVYLDAIKKMMATPKGMEIDFRKPQGAPALVPADGVSWQIFANPVSLFIGGVAAVLLELAEPSVRTGVWEHSSFRQDPLSRLHRTGYAAMVTVYAPRHEAERMIGRVVRAHDRVRGKTPDGQDYYANDPRLLDWVHATATWGFTEAYHLYVHQLTAAQRSSAFKEGETAAGLYGASGAPNDWLGWEALLAKTAPTLEDHPIMSEFLDLMETTPLLPKPLRGAQRLLVRAAVSMTPEPVRSLGRLRDRGLRRGETMLVRASGRMASLFPMSALPPLQATKRMQATGEFNAGAAGHS